MNYVMFFFIVASTNADYKVSWDQDQKPWSDVSCKDGTFVQPEDIKGHDKDVMAAMEEANVTSVWINVKTELKPARYQWLDTEQTVYGENVLNRGECVFFRSKKLFGLKCSKKKKYICRNLNNDADCYEERVTWDQAEERCKNKSAELYYRATPEQKYDDIQFPTCMNQNDNTGYWIGLRKRNITRVTLKQEDGKEQSDETFLNALTKQCPRSKPTGLKVACGYVRVENGQFECLQGDCMATRSCLCFTPIVSTTIKATTTSKPTTYTVSRSPSSSSKPSTRTTISSKPYARMRPVTPSAGSVMDSRFPLYICLGVVGAVLLVVVCMAVVHKSKSKAIKAEITLKHVNGSVPPTPTETSAPLIGNGQVSPNNFPEVVGFRFESPGSSTGNSVSSCAVQETEPAGVLDTDSCRSARVLNRSLSSDSATKKKTHSAIRYVRSGSCYAPDTSDTYMQPVQRNEHRRMSPPPFATIVDNPPEPPVSSRPGNHYVNRPRRLNSVETEFPPYLPEEHIYDLPKGE